MKLGDSNALLEAWAPLSHLRNRAAVLDTSARVTRTFAEIEEESVRFEQTLFHELNPGEVVAIQIGNHPSWPALLLALWRRRLVVLPLEPTLGKRELNIALQTCLAAAIVTANVAGRTDSEQVTLRSLPRHLPDWGPNSPSLLKLTSGKTAAPRAVRFRPEQLLADCAQICETMGITDADLNFGVISSFAFLRLQQPTLAVTDSGCADGSER